LNVRPLGEHLGGGRELTPAKHNGEGERVSNDKEMGKERGRERMRREETATKKIERWQDKYDVNIYLCGSSVRWVPLDAPLLCLCHNSDLVSPILIPRIKMVC
jgi:hypothetical protein